MAQSNMKFIIVFLFILLSGCSNKSSFFLTQANKVLKEQKSKFSKDSYQKNLLSHFPKRIKNDSVSFGSDGPSCPPTYKCYKQFGDVVFIVDKPDYLEELSDILKGEIAYKTTYTDSNIIINLSGLRRDFFPVEKCNKWYANKLPIPYFESYNFGLGQKETKKEVNGETHYNCTYTIPADLQVYVIAAEAGNFWKEQCNEKRPVSLKEWQNGYSRGIAISEKGNIIVYWTMIW